MPLKVNLRRSNLTPLTAWKERIGHPAGRSSRSAGQGAWQKEYHSREYRKKLFCFDRVIVVNVGVFYLLKGIEG